MFVVLFQTREPATANDLLPSLVLVLVLVLATTHVREAAERSRRVSSLIKLQSSPRYRGAKLFNALNTSVATLNSTRRRTGSQCNSRRKGAICSHRPAQVTSLATAIWTDCCRCRRLSVMPCVAVVQTTGTARLDQRPASDCTTDNKPDTDVVLCDISARVYTHNVLHSTSVLLYLQNKCS